MAAHKFKVGQTVYYTPGRMSALASSRGTYKILRLLPPEEGDNQYRIKGTSEPFERIAKESHLSRSGG